MYRQRVPVTLHLDNAPLPSVTQFTSASAQVLLITTVIPDERAPLTLHSAYLGQHGEVTAATHLLLAPDTDPTPVMREHPADAMPVADPERHRCLYDHLQQLLDALNRNGHHARVDVVDAALASIDA